jgi:hypothetical protein
MILNKNDIDKVIGEIYKITNITNNKLYIGQTRSHRLNKNKYRPFGYLGRFKDHINECYAKKKGCCKYLNSSILKYGEDNFICEKIAECPVDNLNELEMKYILEYNSKYPTGYNLTDGGKTGKAMSRLGTEVAIGSCYSGIGPFSVTGAAPSATNRWMYATGPVEVHLSKSEIVNESLSQGINANI